MTNSARRDTGNIAASESRVQSTEGNGAYAVELNVKHAFLVYPFSDFHPLTARVGDIHVHSASLDLGQLVESQAKLPEAVCLLASYHRSETDH